MSRFGLSWAVKRVVWGSEPLSDLRSGIDAGRYRIGGEQLPAMLALLSGATLTAMLPVLDGRSAWREVGSDTAELVLVGLGLERDEARALARAELPAPTATA